MPQKFDIYDLLGILIPGVLVVCATSLAFPGLAIAVGAAYLPDEFAFIGLIAVSVFVGYLIQAVASMAEGLMNKTWGGRPSEKALDGKISSRYLPADSAARIRARLASIAGPSASTRSLFLLAMQRAENSTNTRVARFNALYAFHRALLVLNVVILVLFVLSFQGGLAAQLGLRQNAAIIVIMLLLLVILWHRTRQRGHYYVREVLLTADLSITESESRHAGKGD